MPPQSDSYVVAATPRPATFLGRSAAILGDLAIVTGILFAIALTPMAIARVVTFVASLFSGR
jgi:hypothetical protein